MFAALLLLAAAPSPPVIWHDRFEESGAWRPAPADGVALTLSAAEGDAGVALRLDFDFRGRAGWAAIRREVGIDLPENWQLDLRLRGEAPANDLEIKLVDVTGQNVWWAVRRDFAPPTSWSTLRLKKRHFSFAWGPAGGGEIRHVAALEIVVTARAGGSGWMAIDELMLTPLPPPRPAAHPPSVTASSSAPGFPPERAMDGDPANAWQSDGPGPAWIAIEFGEKREYGGLTIQWEPGRFANRYRVETSDDREKWSTARTVDAGNGGRDDLSGRFVPRSRRDPPSDSSKPSSSSGPARLAGSRGSGPRHAATEGFRREGIRPWEISGARSVLCTIAAEGVRFRAEERPHGVSVRRRLPWTTVAIHTVSASIRYWMR